MKTHSIIIPVRDNDGSDNADVIDRVTEELIDTFGGATLFQAQGAWKAPDGTLYKEPVTVIESAGEIARPEEMDRLADLVLQATDQLAVMVKSDGIATIKMKPGT
jgi:hypothetical protein